MASIDLGMVTAYAYAVAGGYTGSEQDFEDLLGNIASDLEEIENLSVTVTTLPEGSQATASYNNGVLSLGIPKGDTGATGAEGPEGPTGPTGNGIQSIEKTGTSGNVDTYTITYTNGQTTTFTVTNGSVTSVDGKTGDVTLDDKANIDGYYEDLTAGYAENLISNVFDEENVPYNFRTAGGSLDIGAFENDEIVGGTVAVNQLLNEASFSDLVTGKGPTVTFSNHRLVIQGTTTAGCNYFFAQGKELLVNHKYVLAGLNKHQGMDLLVYNGTHGLIASLSRSATATSLFINPANTANYNIYFNIGQGGSAVDIDCVPQLIDLTQMFGTTIADYIYTLETGQAGAGVAWVKKLFPKSYYPYNTGELMHVQTSGHKMVGFNQWDEEWEKGQFDGSGNPIANNDCIRSKNFIPVVPNTVYATNTTGGIMQIFFYDDTQTFISSSWLGTITFTTPANCHYMKFRLGSTYGTTYNHDICINLHWDGERDGEYEAYSEHTYQLDSDLVLRGIPKLDSGNKLYYDGDTYEADGTVTRYYGIRAYQAGDENLADAITDKTNTVYKLTTPTTETADTFQNPQSVSNWGTEEYIDTRSIPIPVGHNTKYPPDLKAKLETSPNPPDADGEYLVKHVNGTNEYVALSTNATIQNIIARLEALEG